MEEKGVFKTAVLGGFERQSVLTYIKNLTDIAEQKEKELTQELWESTQRNDELLNMTKEVQGKVQEMEQTLAQEREQAQRLENDFAKALEEIRRLREQVDSRNNDLLLQNERIRQLQKRNEMLELKSKKYDESTMQLGCLLLDAQKKAEAIVEEAQAQGEEIRKEAYQVVDQAKVDAEGIVASAKQTVQETIQGLGVVQNSYGEFKKRIMDSLKGMVKMLDEADNAFAQCKLNMLQEAQEQAAVQEDAQSPG